jgi:hypothetical protein
LKKDTADAFFTVELPHILFQVYAVLTALASDRTFSHNDLHESNILIYTIPNGDRVTMTYKNAVGGETVSFQTRYIAKIIDYGRVYCPESPGIHKALCAAKACAPNCGIKAGFYDILKPTKKKGETFGITYALDAVLNIYKDFVASRIYGHPDHMNAQIARFRYPNEYFLYVDDNPMLHILKHTDVNKDAVMLGASEAMAYNVFHSGEDKMLKAMPAVDTVQKMYWALYYYIQTAPKYRIWAEGAGGASAPFGEFICNLDFNIRHIKPIVFRQSGANVPPQNMAI